MNPSDFRDPTAPLPGDPRFRALYTLPIQGNITMGGNEIVVYATPWTRAPLRGGV